VELRSLGPTERMLALQSMEMLKDAGLSSLMAIAQNCVEFHAPPGHVFVSADQPAQDVHFLLEGEVELTWNGVAQTRSGPWMIGMEAVLASGIDRSARAVGPCITLATPASVILDLLSLDRRFLVQMLRLYAWRLLRANPRRPVLSPGDWPLPPGPPGSPLHSMRVIFHTPLGRCDFDGAANLAPDLEWVRFEPGQTLWDADQLPYYGIVLSGEVEVSGEGGTEITQAPYELGWLCALGSSRFSTSATAISPTEVLRCSVIDLYKALENGPVLSRSLLSLMVARGMRDQGPEGGR